MNKAFKYWDDFSIPSVPKIPNQKLLNTELNQLNPNYHIELSEANPLTVLLLITNESLHILKTDLEKRNENWTKYETKIRTFNNIPYQSPINYHVQQDFSSSGGSAIYTPQIMLSFQDRNQRTQNYFLPEDAIFFGIRAHMSIYSFFNTYSSILDRLANELNKLFVNLNLGNWPNWRKLFNRNISKLRPFDNNLASQLEEFDSELTQNKTLRYRNVHTHNGYLPIEVVPKTATTEWVVFLPEDPDDPNLPININAVNFMQTEFIDLIKFINNEYGILFSKLSNSVPPW